MSARRLVSHLVFGLVPVLAIGCGDDSSGQGGGGNGGGTATTTSTGSTSSPVSVSASSSVTTTTTTTTTSTGTGGTGGTGGGGGGPIGGGVEACPGDEFDLTLGVARSFQNTTEGTADDLDTCFEPDPAYDGGDLVFLFNIPETASTRFRLTSVDAFDGNLIVRSDCEDAGTETCSYQGTARTFAGELPAGPISVIVDTVGAEGTFLLTAIASAPACGDGILNTDEDCDPGAGVPNDGCIDPGEVDACKFEAPPKNADICPGEAIDVPSGASSLLAADGYSTNGFVDDYISSCYAAEGGVERVMALNPAATGTLTVRIGYTPDGTEKYCDIDLNDPYCWDAMLYARSACGDDQTELDCADFDFDVEEISFPVVADTPVFLFVDGYDDGSYSRGPFNLHFDLQP